MLKSKLEELKECCFKCKYGRLKGCKSKVVVVNNEVFLYKSDLQAKYPDIEITPDLFFEYIPEKSTCHKSPPRMSSSCGIGAFPEIDTDNWCGSFKEKESR